MTKIHVHEDDEGMRNVYPANTVAEAMEDLAAAKENSETHLAPSGVGWTEVHPIKEPEKSFRELKVNMQTVSSALENVLPRIREFEVGFGANNPFHYKDDDANCFGFGQSLYLKLEADGDYLKAIWFDVSSESEEELSTLKRAFEVINEIHPSMIADYWLETGGLIEDRNFLDRYFAILRRTATPTFEPTNLNEGTSRPTWWSKVLKRLFGT